MAIAFPEPKPPLQINSNMEIDALNSHFLTRSVPASNNHNLLLASWNIANFGAQSRSVDALKVIAFIMKRFDLIAVQEINDDYRKFTKTVELMGDEFDFVMSDTAGNTERLAYVFNRRKVKLGKLFGEVALRPRIYPKRDVKVHYRQNRQNKVQVFKGLRYTPFDRNPFIGSFSCNDLEFVLANVHLYFGKFQQSSKESDRLKYARRVLEIHALAKWAKERLKSGNAWNKHIVLLGDMNVPNMRNNEATIKALREFSWTAVDLYKGSYLAKTEKLTRVGGSNLGNDKTYDQIAFAPTDLKSKIKSHGVFDFDAVVFRDKWGELTSRHSHASAVRAFNKYLRRYLSDHRPIWVELKTHID
tara:strand:- start:38997 stop:40073 length:1077 start_codon:yes stop_codon:yes gene_type:complete